MLTTLTIASAIVALRYTIKAGPTTIIRALRDPNVPRRYKLALAVCALPIPGPFDNLIAAALLTRIAALTTNQKEQS